MMRTDVLERTLQRRSGIRRNDDSDHTVWPGE